MFSFKKAVLFPRYCKGRMERENQPSDVLIRRGDGLDYKPSVGRDESYLGEPVMPL